MMKWTTMGVTRIDYFFKCVHFRPKRTYTGNKPAFGACCRGRGATGHQGRCPHAVVPGEHPNLEQTNVLRELRYLMWHRYSDSQ